MNIEKINLKVGESVKVTVDNYDSQIPLKWEIIQGTVQAQPDINDPIRKSAVITDHTAGESIIVVSGMNTEERACIIHINTYNSVSGDLLVTTNIKKYNYF